MVQHLQMWDYVSLSGTMDGRMIEYVDQQHEQFMNPVVVLNAKYIAPSVSIYGTLHFYWLQKDCFFIYLSLIDFKNVTSELK